VCVCVCVWVGVCDLSSDGIEIFVGVREILELFLIDIFHYIRVGWRQDWLLFQEVYIEVANIPGVPLSMVTSSVVRLELVGVSVSSFHE
jgi:hypothetical protein